MPNHVKRFICVQMGARLNYAIATILEQAGLLELLYTDLCADAGLGAWLKRRYPPFLRPALLNRLLNRQLPIPIPHKIQTCDGAALRLLVRQKLAGQDLDRHHQALHQFYEEFGTTLIRRGVGHATHVFSTFGEGANFLEFAKSQGCQIVMDVYISPAAGRILQQERQAFAEIESVIPTAIIQREHAYFKRASQVTDLFIAPSPFVIEGLQEFGIASSQCRLVPYGVDDSWFQLSSTPAKGRILFVGAATLRKGIHILGQAAQQLATRGYEFRIVGDVTDQVRTHPLTQHLQFLGRIPRSQVKQEYVEADILVLPSLAEGSAGVTYEALATGLPVITTPAAGSVVRDGIEGFIIPDRDPMALAQRIETLVENRTLRDRMAQAARDRAQAYTWEKYAERLLAALNSST